MTNISYKATNRSNTLCIARFGNAVNDVCHRNSAVREIFRGSLKFIQEIEKTVGDGRCGGRLILLLFYRKELYYET